MSDFEMNKSEVSKLIPAVLGLIIFVMAGILIYESGSFYNSVFEGHSPAYGFLVAVALETLAAALIVVTPHHLGAWLLRSFILLGLSIVIVAGSSLHATKPTRDADNFAASDKIKLDAMDRNIKSLEMALEAVRGQPQNSAIASRRLSEANEIRSQFIISMKPDSDNELVNSLKCWILVALRILMQAGNWILIHRLGAIGRRYFDENPVNNHDIQNPVRLEQSKYDALPAPEKAQKPRDFVLSIVPKAVLARNNGHYEVRDGDEILGIAKNASLAWAEARKGLVS